MQGANQRTLRRESATLLIPDLGDVCMQLLFVCLRQKEKVVVPPPPPPEDSSDESSSSEEEQKTKTGVLDLELSPCLRETH